MRSSDLLCPCRIVEYTIFRRANICLGTWIAFTKASDGYYVAGLTILNDQVEETVVSQGTVKVSFATTKV